MACPRGRALDLGSGMTFEHCLTLDSEVLWHLTFSSEAGGKDVDHRRAKCVHLPFALETQDEGGDRGVVSVGFISAYPRKALAGWS